MEFKDYYKILGVDEKADTAAIKSAYRKLARKFHPDVSKEADAEQRFKEVTEAWEVLKDEGKRREYDQLRKYGGSSGGGFRPPPGWQGRTRAGQGGQPGEGFSDFSDFFEAFFGGGGAGFAGARRAKARRGEDLRHSLSVSLEEAYAGTQRTLNLTTPDGASRSLNVKIPAGTTHGQTMRLRGQGGPGGHGGAAGDLLLSIEVAPHPLFRLDGRDVWVSVEMYPWQAALGDKIRVPTLGGEVSLKIPAGSQSGRQMRMVGRGLPGKPPGDQRIELRMVLPEQLSERQKQLLEQLAEASRESSDQAAD